MTSIFPCQLTGPANLHCQPCWKEEVHQHLVRHLHGPREEKVVWNSFFDQAAVRSWSEAFGKWQPRMEYGGVFVHQRPMVSLSPGGGGRRDCELADILLVFTDLNGLRRRAILLQAKTATSTQLAWPPPPPRQWRLYTSWPLFEYVGPNGRVTRDLPFRGTCDRGAKYLLLDPTMKEARSAMARMPRRNYRLWLETEWLMLQQSGREFSWDRGRARDDWDHLIWDLIENTATQMGGKTIGHQKRGAGFLKQLSGGNVLGEPPEDATADEAAMDDAPAAISIAHVQAGSPGENRT